MLEYPLLCFLDIAFQFANINLCHVNSVNFDIEICVEIVVFQKYFPPHYCRMYACEIWL